MLDKNFLKMAQIKGTYHMETTFILHNKTVINIPEQSVTFIIDIKLAKGTKSKKDVFTPGETHVPIVKHAKS